MSEAPEEIAADTATGAAQLTWVVTVADATPLPEMVHKLELLKLAIVDTLAELHMVVVRGSAHQAERARALPGVEHVEQEAVFDINRPET